MYINMTFLVGVSETHLPAKPRLKCRKCDITTKDQKDE